MNAKHRASIIKGVLSIFALLWMTGCATTAMKGTPFYTGEWEERTGPVEDRVNVWPFVYYREPALSVLWPIFEKTPDHVAVRPLYSVRGLESGQKVHRVLWPIAEFDTHRNQHRIFPVFWGEEEFVVFPVYWHFDRPFSGDRGTNSLFPLWIYQKRGADRTVLHLAWPLARFERQPDYSRNRVFPLFSHARYPNDTRYFRSVLFGYETYPAQEEHHGWLLPLATWKRSPDDRYLFTLPYSYRARDGEHNRYAAGMLWGHRQSDSRVHHWLFPLYSYREREPESRFISPLVYRRQNTETDEQLLWIFPLYRDHQRENARTQLLLPLVYRHRDAESSSWYTLLGGSTKRADGSSTQLILPLVYRHRDAESSSWYTLLGGGTKRADGSRTVITPLYLRVEQPEAADWTVIPPLLSWRVQEPDYTQWQVLGPLARFHSGEREGDSWVFPFFYRNQQKNFLLTPVYQSGGDDTARWRSVFPLYFQRNTEFSDQWITPLFAVTRKTDGTGRTITPLYARVEDRPGAVTRILPPLLSWQHEREGQTDNWLLGGLARWGRGDEPAASHVIPFYYRNPGTETFVSLPYAAWTRENDRIRVIPPLLYAQTEAETGEKHGQWLFGVGSRRRDADGEVTHSHLLPFYLNNREENRMFTPLYARWERTNGGTTRVIPPALSWRNTDPDGARKDRYALGLAGQRRDAEGDVQSAHLFPLFAFNHEHQSFFTPLYARWTLNNENRMQLIPPALSWRTTDPDGTRKDRALLGVAGKTINAEGETTASHVFPLYHWRRDTHFYTVLFGQDAPETGRYRYWLTPLVGTYRNQDEGFWVAPLINWRRDAETGHADSRFLLWGRHVTTDTRSNTSWFPLFDHQTAQDIRDPRRNRQILSRDQFTFLLLYQNREETFRYRPGQGPRINQQRFRYQEESANRLFPLWTFNSTAYGNRETVDDGPGLSTGNVLWRLYDTRTETGTEDQPHEYVRRRILWRVWHYERLNGEVSVDAFPFISHDRKEDGFRRTSFMWRVFRYENHPEEGRKLDILFLPLRRG